MTQTYYGVNGKNFDVNNTGNYFLSKLTFCLWDKAGIPRPLSKEDAILVSRLLRNYISLQQKTTKDVLGNNLFWRMYGFVQDTQEDLEWVVEIIEFFENCEGLMTEEEYSKI